MKFFFFFGKRLRFPSYLSYAMFLTYRWFFFQLSSAAHIIFEIQYPEADLAFQLRPYQCGAGQRNTHLGLICLYITQYDTSLSSNNMISLTHLQLQSCPTITTKSSKNPSLTQCSPCYIKRTWLFSIKHSTLDLLQPLILPLLFYLCKQFGQAIF